MQVYGCLLCEAETSHNPFVAGISYRRDTFADEMSDKPLLTKGLITRWLQASDVCITKQFHGLRGNSFNFTFFDFELKGFQQKYL